MKHGFFNFKILGNCTIFGIIRNDFKSSNNWAIQNKDQFSGENPQIAGIQSNHEINQVYHTQYMPVCFQNDLEVQVQRWMLIRL